MSTKISASKIIIVIHNFAWIMLAVFFCIALVLSVFLYNNIYKAITQNEEIVVLQGQLALEPVDIALFRKILTRIELKKAGYGAGTMLQTLKNPFLPYDKLEEKLKD